MLLYIAIVILWIIWGKWKSSQIISLILVLCHKTAGNLGGLFWEWEWWAGVGGYHEESRPYWVKKKRLRLEVYDTWWFSDTFQFLFDSSFCHYLNGKNTESFIMWLSKSSDSCNRASAEGYRGSFLDSVPVWIQRPEMLGESISITVIPKCALAAAKPSQKPGQPAPCGWQPWGSPTPWRVHWTHSVRPRQTARYIV